MGWKPHKRKWRWRDFLTSDERAELAEADRAKEIWRKLNVRRAAITNRAIQRAKYDARSKDGR